MEKISGILPGSARLSAVDLKESPVRPGTPSFGRPEGVSSLREAMMARPAIIGTQRIQNLQTDQLDWRAKDARSAAMAAEIAEKFFIKNERYNEAKMAEPTGFSQTPAIYIVAPERMSKPAGFKTDEVGSLRATSLGTVHSPDFEESADDSGLEIAIPTEIMEPAEVSAPAELSQPEGLFPKGSFIDREV